jgi:hypothetical protein
VHLDQAPALVPHPRDVGHVGVRLAAPEGERVLQRTHGARRRVPGPRGARHRRDGRLEDRRVEPTLRDPQRVPAVLRHEHLGPGAGCTVGFEPSPEVAGERRERAAPAAGRARGRVVLPQVVREPLERDGPTACGGEPREQLARSRTAQVDLRAVAQHPDRPEHLDAQLHAAILPLPRPRAGTTAGPLIER